MNRAIKERANYNQIRRCGGPFLQPNMTEKRKKSDIKGNFIKVSSTTMHMTDVVENIFHQIFEQFKTEIICYISEHN